MEFMISYFYQVRFFTPNMIPISTALYDPAWYKGANHRDENGVWIGFNDERFHPSINSECSTCSKDEHRDPTKCGFIKNYYDKISKLNFQDVVDSYKLLGDRLGIPDPIFVLIVHEAPWNPCSERSSLIRWFKENGISLKEFSHVKKEK